MASKYFFAIRNGRKIGVVDSWQECSESVTGYSGAQFKKFHNYEAAQKFVDSNFSNGGNDSSNNYGEGKTSSRSQRSDVSSTESFENSGSQGNSNSHSSTNSETNLSSITLGSASKSESPKNGVYAVASGRNSGIFSSWKDCRAQVDGYRGANYKKFSTRAEAERFLQLNNLAPLPTLKPLNDIKSEQVPRLASPAILSNSKSNYYSVIYSDGSSEILRTWEECLRNIEGLPGVYCKKFQDLDEARKFVNIHSNRPRPISSNRRTELIDQFLERNSKELLQEQTQLKPYEIYCDGSYFADSRGRRAGYGVYYGENDHRNISAPLSRLPYNSFVAELEAIKASLKNIKAEIDHYKNHEVDIMPKYVIKSDSEVVKKIIEIYAPTWSEDKLANHENGQDIKEVLDDYRDVKEFYEENRPIFNDHRFEIQWVRGHVGKFGNERADRLARKGASKSQTRG